MLPIYTSMIDPLQIYPSLLKYNCPSLLKHRYPSLLNTILYCSNTNILQGSITNTSTIAPLQISITAPNVSCSNSLLQVLPKQFCHYVGDHFYYLRCELLECWIQMYPQIRHMLVHIICKFHSYWTSICIPQINNHWNLDICKGAVMDNRNGAMEHWCMFEVERRRIYC